MKTIKIYLSFLLIITSTLFSQNPQIVQLVNQVNKDSIALYIRQLSGDTSCIIGGSPYTIISRHKNQPGNDKAGQFIYEKFQSFGLQVQYESFSSTGKNVIATKQGLFDSQKYFVVCAHYDDMPSGTTAPGADDNASGTATVLELARVLSQYNFNYTIKFICFDEEEQGLVGSNYYATQARNRNDSIIGVINLDMTAYDANNDGIVDVHSNSVANTSQIANAWIDNIYEYGISLTPRLVASQPYSDHYSFQQKNYGAILVIEYDLEFNPRYHTVNDKFQYLNMNYAHKIAQVTAATVSEYAQVSSYNVTSISINSGWNLLSIPLNPSDRRRSIIFPTSVSYAYTYEGGYVIKDTLELGKGYWLKFNSPQNQFITGQSFNSYQIQLKQGWNLIGALNGIIPTSSISTSPPNIISSMFYEFNGTYSPSEQLEKGKGYWVKSSQDGILTLALTSKISALNKFSIDNMDYVLIFRTDESSARLYLTSQKYDKEYYEMPPQPPSGIFDVRFVDNSLVNNILEDKCIVNLNGIKSDLEISLDEKSIDEPLILQYELSGFLNETILTKGEKIKINNAVSSILLKKQTALRDYLLYQNYPNPFNPNTNIKFYNKEKSKISLLIYNLQGQLVKTLVDEELDSGFYSINFDGSNLPSGIYFYELRAKNFRDIKKMILLK